MPTQRRALVVLLAVLAVFTTGTVTGAQAKSPRSETKGPWKRVSTTVAPTTEVPAATTTTSTTVAPAPTTTTTSTSTPTPTTLPTTGTRVAAEWPFSATSPWNLGVGAGAQFESSGAPRTASLLDPAVTAWINAGSYSHPVYRATSSDPLATVTRGTTTFQYRIPDHARPSGGSDEHMHVVEPGGRYAHESWNMVGANPLWTTGYTVRTDLWSTGMGERGVRAYGGSALGGIVRTAELTAGHIPHALALAITGNQLKTGWVWPATTQDGNASSTYFGQVPMGTYAAIPPGVDLGGLGLTREGLALARALQDYGAYVVDRAGAFVLSAEPSLDGTTALANARRDLVRLRPYLRVVANNSPTSINGGGLPRVPAAPPFAP